MPSTAETWNSRYGDPSFHPASRPNPFLLEVLPFLPRGRALDLACGAGQNAIELAARGWRVTGIDISPAALDRAEASARARNILVRRAIASRLSEKMSRELSQTPPGKLLDGREGILLIRADLESFALPSAAFDVILCFRYLQRPLFPAIERALRPGGVLVLETFTVEQLSFEEGPRNREHLLRVGELREAFPDLATLFYREWKGPRTSPAGALPCSAAPQGSTSVQRGTSAQGGCPGHGATLGEAAASLLARKPLRR